MDAQECHRQATQLETLLQEVTAFPDPQVRAKTEELLQALLEMYGEGLSRLLATTARSSASGQDLIDLFARDELISSLLLLHGLHPLDLEARINQALNEVRSSTQAHGSSLELLRVEDGIAYLRIAGNCQGCSSSRYALKQRVEKAVYDAAPDLSEVRIVENSAPQQTAVPVKFVPPRKRKECAPTEEPTETLPDKTSASRVR